MSRSSMIVCCMCGDVGFADKLFRCSRCTSRFQHSYCSNYYSSSQSATQIDICDWCQYEESNSSSSSRRQASATTLVASKRSSTTDQLRHRQLQANSRSEYSSSGDRVKQHDQQEENKGKQAGVPSPRTATKRYKLLKDVMC